MRTTLEYDGVQVPIKVKQERRNNIRYSITGKSVNVLIPKGIIGTTVLEEVEKAKIWCKKEFDKKPHLLNRFRVIVYTNGEFLHVFGKDFKLLIFEEARKGLTGKMVRDEYIEVRVPQGADQHQVQEAIGKLLSRVFSSFFHKDIVKRVMYYNNKYFQEDIVSIKLKNNQSNWGSCSTKKNINLSSRLLFAPLDVLDYVIVHELSHLKEMNHSARFWKIVHDVMPNYKEKEDWLTKYGHTLRY